MAGAALSARSPRSEIRVSERSSRFNSFICASSGMSESVVQLARRSTATGLSAGIASDRPARAFDPAGIRHRPGGGHECDYSEAARQTLPHHVFLRLGRAESRSQTTWHLGSFSFNRLTPFSVNIVW